MNKRVNKFKIIMISIVMVALIIGCSESKQDNNEVELQLTVNELKADNNRLSLENKELQKSINEMDKVISNLKEEQSRVAEDPSQAEVTESIMMTRFSAISRLIFQPFNRLESVYNITTEYKIKDDWYLINGELFEIELLGYESASKVKFSKILLESEDNKELLSEDMNAGDGWNYKNDNISKKIHPHGINYGPFYLIYAEVTLEDGRIEKTPLLPIYNVSK